MPKLITDQAVFEAVVNCIIQNGYAGATTREIAEMADVNEATLFRKYGSKEELVIKAIEYHQGRLEADRFLEYTGDVEADLKKIVQLFNENDKSNRQLMAVIIAEMPRVPELRKAAERPQLILTKVGQLLARYQADGVLRQEHPLHAVASLIAPFVILNLFQQANPHLPFPLPDIDQHIEAYLNGRVINEGTDMKDEG